MINITSHSSIKITGSKTIWFDPFEISTPTNDADIIFITHSHYDHYSPDDIKKVRNESTIIVAPRDKSIESDYEVSPGDVFDISGIKIEVIPAYNIAKLFHPKSKKWVGYLVTMDNRTYYVCGDTDATTEALNVKCDVLLVPCGGKYTMNTSEAAVLANTIMPETAIPTHYGSVVGKHDDGEEFKRQLNPEIKCNILI